MYKFLLFLWGLNVFFYLLVIILIIISYLGFKHRKTLELADMYSDFVVDFLEKISIYFPYKHRYWLLLIYPLFMSLVLGVVWYVYIEFFYVPETPYHEVNHI